jgi:hypothetical protein
LTTRLKKRQTERQIEFAKIGRERERERERHQKERGQPSFSRHFKSPVKGRKKKED